MLHASANLESLTLTLPFLLSPSLSRLLQVSLFTGAQQFLPPPLPAGQLEALPA